jgi:hypothetical protein
MPYRSAALISLMLMFVAPCMAQAPAAPAPSNAAPSQSPPASDTAPPPSSSAATPSATSTSSTLSAESSTASASDPSPEMIKKARSEGFKAEKQKSGATLFCYKDASLGTKFETKKCITPDELQVVIDARQDQRNQLRLRTCTANCNN